MSDVISLAENAARERGIKPLYIGIMKVVDESHNVRSSEKNVIVISKTNILIFSADPFKFMKRHSWIQLNHLSYEEKTVQLQFDQERYFWLSNEIYLVMQQISESIQQILKYTELKKLNFSPYKDRIFKPSANSALQRAKSFISNRKINIDEKSFNNFENIFYTSQTSVKIQDISLQEDIYSLISDALPLYPNLISIEVQKSNNIDTFEIAKSFAKERCNVEYISVDGEVSGTFNRFVSSLKHNRTIPLYGLGFSNSNFYETHLDRLKELITRKKIRSLTFNKAINSRSMKHFYNSFLNSEIGDNLIYLNLNRSTNISLSLILPNVLSIQYLSLENCELDIVKSLITISKYRFPNLVALNLSKNECSSSIGLATVKLPQSIESFSMNEIKWGSDSFVTFLDLIFSSYRNGLKLSIANAKMDYDCWTNVFDFLGSIPYTKLSSLIWDNNPIVHPFIEFLEHNENISYLSLNGCFEASNYGIFHNFLESLEIMKNLSSLSLRGYKSKSIANFLKNFVEAAIETKIEYLDLSDNAGGEDSLIQYQILLEKAKNLRVLVVDGTKPSNANKFKDFLETASESKVFVSFPFNDSEHLVNSGKIAREDIKEFMLIMNLSKSSSEMLNVFHEEECPSFPIYIVPDQQSESEKPKIENDKKSDTPKSPVREKRLFELGSFAEAKTLDPEMASRSKRHHSHPRIKSPESKVDVILQKSTHNPSPHFANEIVQLASNTVEVPPEPEPESLCTSATDNNSLTNDEFDGRSGAATVGDPMTLGEVAVEHQKTDIEGYNPRSHRKSPRQRQRIAIFNTNIASDNDEMPLFLKPEQNKVEFKEEPKDESLDPDVPMQTIMMDGPIVSFADPQPEKKHRRRRRKKSSGSKPPALEFNWDFPNMNQGFEEEEEEYDIWEILEAKFSFDANFDALRTTPPYYLRKK